MTKISAYIIAFNEESKIEDAVRSVSWADEVLLIDSGSSDRTAGLAEALGARTVQVPFNGFGDLRNQAIAACAHGWIFSLDADERCTAAVRDEILELVASDDPCDAYNVPRRNYFLGRWIKHGGWYPDYRQPQLFRKGRLSYTEEAVHEGFELDGRLCALQNAIWQFPFENLEQFIHKMQRYSTLGVERLEARGVRSSMPKAFVHGLWAFIRIYILKRSFLDGWPGFVIAFGYCEHAFYRYAKAAERQQQWSWPKDPPK